MGGYISTALSTVGSIVNSQGFQIVMMLGSLLFNKLFQKDRNRSNDTVKLTSAFSRTDVVPCVIGTDMAGGTIVYLHDVGHKNADFVMDKVGTSENIIVNNDVTVLYMDFVVAFAGNYFSPSYRAADINRMYVSNFDIWYLASAEENVRKYSEYDPDVTVVDVDLHSENGSSRDDRFPCTQLCYAKYAGLFSVPTTHWNPNTFDKDLESADPGDPMSHPDNINASGLSGTGGIRLADYFPPLSAEVSSIFTQYSSLAFREDNFTGGPWQFKDGLSRYSYGMDQDDYVVNEGYTETQIKRYDVYSKSSDVLADQDDSISMGGTSMSRQYGDRLYVFQYHNWNNPYTDSVIEDDHHHANWSCKYSLFYIDRSDDSVHSVSFDTELHLQGGETGSCPTFKAGSMELTDDYVLVFGKLMGTDFAHKDYRQIDDNVNNSQTKIYCDLSAYPEGYWVDYWACIYKRLYEWEYRRITEQTSEYIVVDAPFGYAYEPLDVIMLDKALKKECEWAVIEEGSTRNVIYVTIPNWELILGTNHWDQVFIEGTVVYGLDIDQDNTDWDGGILILSDPLHRDPAPGEKIWFIKTYIDGDYILERTDIGYPSIMEVYDLFNPQFEAEQTLLVAHHHKSWDEDGDDMELEIKNMMHDGDREYILGIPLLNMGDYLRYDNIDSFGRGYCSNVILRFDRLTGEFIDVFKQSYSEYYTSIAILYGFRIAWQTFQTCATDGYVFYSFPNLVNEPGSSNEAESFYGCIRKSDMHEMYFSRGKTVEEHMHDNYVTGLIYRDAKKLKTLNDSGEYEDHWYAICYDFNTADRVYSPNPIDIEITGPVTTLDGQILFTNIQNPKSIGIYLIDLGTDGYFPEIPGFVSYKSLYTYRESFVKIVHLFTGFDRIPVHSSGGMTICWYDAWNTLHENSCMAITNYSREVFFTVMLGHGNYYGIQHTQMLWKYNVPSDYYKDGRLVCINMAAEKWSNFYKSYTGTYRFNGCCLYMIASDYITGSGYVYSNYVDENPIMAMIRVSVNYEIDRVMNSGEKHPVYMDYGSFMFGEYDTVPTTVDQNGSDYAICDEIISDKVYWQTQEFDIEEPRYLYSRTLDSSWKVFDLYNDIMQTFKGYMVFNGEHYNVKVPHANETVQHCFGIDSDEFESNQLSDAVNKIYCNLSRYSTDYWKGDFVSFEYDGRSYENIVLSHTETYLTVCDNVIFDGYTLENTPKFPSGLSFTLTKDNIKKGSFQYSRKSKYGQANKIRIEYVNRLMDYTKQVVEVEDYYDVNSFGWERIEFYQMHGIKRATQAGRRALLELDYQTYVRWMCSFVTDIVGFMLVIGDIISVTHPVTGWNKKEFRIVAMEELPDYEVKLDCEEYNRSIFHDIGVPQIQGLGTGNPSIMQNPESEIDYFEVIEDTDMGCLYFVSRFTLLDSKQYSEIMVSGTWLGTDDADFQTIVSLPPYVVSAVLMIGLSDDVYQSKVYFDPTTVVGEFPENGYFYINNVLFRYRGVDVDNYCFVNCMQGVDHVHPPQTHSAGSVISERSSMVPYAYYYNDDSWVGEEIELKAVTLSNNRGAYNVFNTILNFVLYTKTINGTGNNRYTPVSLKLEEIVV